MTTTERCDRRRPIAVSTARAATIAAVLALALATVAAAPAVPEQPSASSGAEAAGRAAAGGTRPAALQSGDPAPAVVFETLDGDHVAVSQLRGKVVVLDFWATWCGPCQAALPSLKKLAKDHGDRSFVLLSVSGDTNGARLRDFVVGHEMNWTQCWDGNADAQRAFGVKAFPTYFVIDKAGRIRYTRSGWGRGADRDLGREIDRALAQSAGGAPAGGTAAPAR